MTTVRAPTAANGGSTKPAPDRRRFDRSQFPTPSWTGQDTGTPDEVARMRDLLKLNARQLAEMRARNEQLAAMNSELRCQLGVMTLQWVDACGRVTR